MGLEKKFRNKKGKKLVKNIEKNFGKTRSTVSCHNCGKMCHFAYEYTKQKKVASHSIFLVLFA